MNLKQGWKENQSTLNYIDWRGLVDEYRERLGLLKDILFTVILAIMLMLSVFFLPVMLAVVIV